MALSPGARIGSYEISSLLGVGGMGEVYRARDSKLNRDVALKVLPEAFAADPDRLARFKREAQVLASLNHPHIAAIYGLEEADGSQFLVLELVEGETLAARLRSGPVPLAEALTIARQVAEACQAAHEKGIVHRDLKPANVAFTADDQVKVLDFGLAKALEPSASADVTNSPTISLAATRAGVILGTAAYMSPEQAKGREADKRSDVWAFGAVLYEMLTGKRPFDAEDLSTTLAAVIMKDPDWGALPASVPLGIRALIQRCLEKDRRQRIADISVALFVLTDPATSAAARVGAAPAMTESSSAIWQRALPWAVAAVLLVGLGVPTAIHFREQPRADPPETRTEIVTPATDDPVSFALSPDGRQLVFVASGDGPSRLWLRSLSATTAQPLAGTNGAAAPFWSPDDRSVGFFADSKLKRLDLGGGVPRVLSASAIRGGTWNLDGVILFSPRTTGGSIFRISASGGEPVAVTTLGRHTYHRWPQFLPDGRHFLYYAFGTPETTGIYLGSLDSEEPTRLTLADTGGLYASSSGWLWWIRDRTLMAQRLDLQRRALTGEPVTIADQLAWDSATRGGAFSVTAAGLAVYRSGSASRRQLQWFDRNGKALGLMGVSDEAALSAPRVTPDGRRVLVHRTVQQNTDIWLLGGTRVTRLTFDAALDRFPRWSPDGTRFVFDSTRQGQGIRNLYLGHVDSPGSETLLLESPQDKSAHDWSADGRFLLYLVQSESFRDLWVLPLDGDRPLKPWLFLKTSFENRAAQFSPDGHWVAYESNQSGSGQYEVYVRPFVASEGGANSTVAPGARASVQWQVSTSGGIHPRWRPDGKELFYIGRVGQMMAVPIMVSGTTLVPGAPAELFQTRIFGGGAEGGQTRQYDVAGDGRFLINTVLDDAAAPITLLSNWKPPSKP